MRLLVVEDDSHLQEQLKAMLTGAGYSVDLAADGQEGLYLGMEYEYDLAIIDLGLPKLNGVDLIRALRKENYRYPILILTARDHWQEKVNGLEAGADDYVVKPFHEEEVIARLNALLRRSAGLASPTVEKGPISLNTASQKVSVNGREVDLTSYEYKVLEYLMLHPDEVVSKMTLTEHIYDQDFDRDSNVIEVFVGRLRKKIDPDNSYKPIETLRGRGYRLSLSS
ncbi:MAG: response regulator transcription factor [Ketobacteraceae bacterium]|nr:response regulator transcription factor [Ketobacteraceae bacterium]